MAILGSELKWYQSATVNDTGSNGGRVSSTQIVSGTSNTWWPNVTEAQLTSGATQWRKSFLRNANASNETAYNVRIGLWKPMPEDDEMYLASGTQTNIQSQLSSPSLYGAGKLDSSIISGATSLNVLVDDGATIIFRNGGLIRISDQTTPGGSGNYDYATISGTPSVNGDVVTITLASGVTHDYSATDTWVSSIIETATLIGTTSGKVVTSSAGTFDANQMTVGNIGSMYQTLTFTFTSATAFTVASDLVTLSPASGVIGSTYAPTNVTAGASYFSIPAAAWGGTWATNDTLVIVTVPPVVPLWEKRVIPVGASAISSETQTIFTFVES